MLLRSLGVRLFLYLLFSSMCLYCREKIAEMYDFALDKVGLDISSYSIYADYIAFLKSVYVCCLAR